MIVGLRVDVDTLRGTLLGTPALCRTFARHGIRASFFFSVGPDNMGRHLWRLLRPAFLLKMLRSRAAKLYGWDILLRGTFWPGPVIGERAAPAIREAVEAGHEIGLHAWDHHAWQARVERMSREQIAEHLAQGMKLLESVAGTRPTCSATPSWRCTESVLEEKLAYPFVYNSDCRGESIFRPAIAGDRPAQPQVPCTLPTLDEVAGRDGVTAEGYYRGLLERFDEPELKVLTIHAEVEGIVYERLFDDFVGQALARGHRFAPLGELLAERQADEGTLPCCEMIRGEVPGREGWVSFQSTAPSPAPSA